MNLPSSEGASTFVDIGWVIGFVDGEGCFSISFVRQDDRGNRKGYRTRIQVTHEFVVTQGAKSVDSLNDLRLFFGVGQIVTNTRHDNHREDLLRYVVRRRDDLSTVIIPFFTHYPLRTAKRLDFSKFVECFRLIEENRHLAQSGLLQIATIASSMNRRRTRNVV